VPIQLHGGGFMVGARFGAQSESTPIAGIGKVKVVAVDYRMFPEARHPAAIEDVIAVYREILKTYKPENIGVFGCSAGGILTAQVTAALQVQKLPRPGAIGIFCHGAGVLAGDSNYLGNIASGMPPPATQPPANDTRRLGYFAQADLKDPIVSPFEHPDVLRQFPPTLVLTGTRDFTQSAAVRSHALLRKANVDAQLYVMEGLGHGAHVSLAGIPEALDANTEIWKFFDAHLGR
jgi:acetyl esterase/lipase